MGAKRMKEVWRQMAADDGNAAAALVMATVMATAMALAMVLIVAMAKGNGCNEGNSIVEDLWLRQLQG